MITYGRDKYTIEDFDGLGNFDLGMLVKAYRNIYPTKPQTSYMASLAERGYMEPNEPQFPKRWRLTEKGRAVLLAIKEEDCDAFLELVVLWANINVCYSPRFFNKLKTTMLDMELELITGGSNACKTF